MSGPLTAAAEAIPDSDREGTLPVVEAPAAEPSAIDFDAPLIIPPSRAQRLTQPDVRPRSRGRGARTWRPRLAVVFALAGVTAIVVFVVRGHRQATLTQAWAAVSRTAAAHDRAAKARAAFPAWQR